MDQWSMRWTCAPAASLDLTPAGARMSHWWRQEGHPVRIAPV